MSDFFDLVIQNGRTIDPAAGLDGNYSVGIRGHKIAAVSEMPLSGTNVIDASGCIVIPGLIDYHTHLFDGGSVYGIRPDFLLSQGITAAVDAGTSGSAGFEVFYRSIVQTSAVTVRAFISLGATGLCDPNHQQNYDRRKVNVSRLQQLKELYPDIILGIKVSLSRENIGELGIEPVRSAVELAGEIGDLRVCVHSTDPPCDSTEILKLLRAGDILCHCYHGTGSCILDEQDKVRQAYLDARSRGVLFDMANGISHFSHRCATHAIQQGFLPDIISSDMVSFAYGLSKRNRSLPYVMSKLLAMGMGLQDILCATTDTPAALMGLRGNVGTLAPGADADIAIMRLENRTVRFEDADMETFRGETLFCPQMTIKRGQVAFFQNTFNL